MRILAIDVGTGTQDILVFDSTVAMTNSPKMVMPSPTSILHSCIQEATSRGKSLLLTGVTMGGGPSKGALRQHLKAGLKAYATPDAARTFDDDLELLEEMGITIISADEARGLRDVVALELKDIDLPAISRALELFGISRQIDALAVAVLDHGAAPRGTSDRQFRFQNLRSLLERDSTLLAFIYMADEVPPYLTRMKAVVQSVDADLPRVLMDTGPAAVLGASEDPDVSRHKDRVVVNAGNSHTIAFHLHGHSVRGMFEHHTRALSIQALDSMLTRLTLGILSNEEVYEDGGHGCVIMGKERRRHFVAVTGPQRGLLSDSTLKPYFPAPYGDMMLTGCYGLVRACALRLEQWRPEIERALAQ
jgi:uncharacterized protein (DUF1786 family)